MQRITPFLWFDGKAEEVDLVQSQEDSRWVTRSDTVAG